MIGMDLIVSRSSGIDRCREWIGLLGLLVTSIASLGCSGSPDPSMMDSGGMGGSGSVGGGGSCNGDAVITTSCATTGCHDNMSRYAGLDLTPGPGVAARLVGVKSPGAAGSACGTISEPYLNAGTDPPTGLLIDKITEKSPPCGAAMPYPGITLLPASTQNCIEQWAEGLIMGTSE